MTNETKNTINNERGKTTPYITIIALLIAMLVIAVSIYTMIYYDAKYYEIYKPEHHTAAHSARFDVKIEHIRREEGKEAEYELMLEYIGISEDWNTHLTLPESEYNKLLGKSYNTLSGEVYELTLEITTPARLSFLPSTTGVTLYRYSFLGETNFTKDEIQEISQAFLDAVKKYADERNSDWRFEELRNRYAPNRSRTYYYLNKDNLIFIED